MTVHTTTQHTPAQLIFGQDSILNTNNKENLQLTKKHKQDLINKGKQQDNHIWKEHLYIKGDKGDKILLKNAWKTKFNQDAYLGPYTITTVRDYATVRACKGKVTHTFNICNITLYME